MSTYYVYFTDRCREDAVQHSVLRDIEKLTQKLEQDQSTRGLEHFPPPYLKKCMGRQGRLVIEEHRIGDDIVLCLARYFIRGGSEYVAFYKDTNAYFESNKVPRRDIEIFLEKRKRRPTIRKPSLSNIEAGYLQAAAAHHYTDDGAFMESYDWFERISQNWAKDYLSRYYDLILDIESGGTDQGATLISHEKNASIKILYRHFPEHKRTFLIAPIHAKNPNDEVELREKYKEVLDLEQVDYEEIIRSSRRAYPSIITYDETIWVRVQNSIEANLALSPEEETILETVLMPTNDGPKYPLFINGRPGSGKSTILQYLFGEHLAHHIELNEEHASKNPPLYLTYSTPLLEQARSSVQNILTCGAKNVQDGRQRQTDDEFDKTLKRSFRNFREFLLEQLPSEVRQNYIVANYIDFDQFRKKWDAKRHKHPVQEVRDIGPELAWHAIRTFIKGMQHEPGSIVDPEYYEIELARDSKSVSDKTFRVIFEQVWENWYQPLCADEGYWDDQDLARSVIEHAAEKLSRYPAVFCDEAQDFTSIELELIERLSLYSDRELPSYLAKHVPFAFAGDPFQTLNPTGFNWDAMQSSFHDNIVQQLDGTGAAKLEFNFQELSFNYRSSEHIVKLANLIQLMRAVLLRIKGLRPQKSWTRKATVTPVWFRRDDASCQSSIREQGELVIIIPCQENGELEYVENDPFLASIALQDGQVSRNILSPARAKGLEYDRVLLYGFGDEASNRVLELLSHIRDPSSEPPEIEQRLAWEYFLNQFYVAVSRARKRLFIVDSGDALEKFWMFTEPKKQHELLDLYRSSEGWSQDDLGGTVQGYDASWSDDRDDPLELADRWKTQGFAQRDPFLLNLAKSNFERANRPEEAQLCEASAYEYSEDFGKAADLFTKLRQSDGACRCYWAGKDAVAVTNLAKEFSEIASDPRYLSASAIIRDRNTSVQIDGVLNALDQVEPMPFPDGPGEIAAWRWFFGEFIEKVAQVIETSDRIGSDWKPSVARIITTLVRLGLPPKAYPDIAKLHYLADDSKAALAHWEECCSDRKQEPEWLTRARAQGESYPANIVYLDRLKDYAAVVEAWRNAENAVSRDTPVNVILKSATEIGDVAAIRGLLPASNDMSKVVSAIQVDGGSAIKELSGAIPVAINWCLEGRSDWGQIVKFAATQITSDGQLNNHIKTFRIEWAQPVLIAAAVRVLARSERLASESSKSQQAISDFLKQHLIIDKNAKKEKQAIMQAVHSLVDVVEVGSAFERAFRLTFALEYYEQWIVKGGAARRLLSPLPDQIDFAKRRWLICKNRLAKAQGGSRGDKHINEVREMEKEWNLSIDQEAEYPALGPLTELVIPVQQEAQKVEDSGPGTPTENEATEKKGSQDKSTATHIVSATVQLSVNDLKLNAEVLTRKQRIVLTKADTEDQLVCGPKSVSSDDVSVEKLKSDSNEAVWKVEEWNLHCEIVTDDWGYIIRFRTSDGCPILGFELLNDK